MKRNAFKVASILNETKQDIPSLRIGQIIYEFHEFLEVNKKIDPYYISDEKYVELLEDYCKGYMGRKCWR